MKKGKTYTFEGKDFSVSWESGLCMHAEECIRAEGDLFEKDRKPWAQPDFAQGNELDRVVGRCPSGALSYEAKDDSKTEQTPAENTVMISANGPLYVRGDLEIEGFADAGEGLAFRAALCRCGKSKNKPFCDNSHIEDGFHESGAVGKEGPGIENKGGKLLIKPTKNGPLLFQGNLSIRAASGISRWSGTKVALCRCGLSENNPFCDGKHREGNFVAD